jgi:methyltransferase-like protein/cyclopropane fatty-acyl-phospholipid synthase-like methyltransferase
MATTTSYDQVIYDSTARYPMHPDCLATLAILTGMSPAPIDRCRYLEIGCANGGNLLSLADALPNSQFVGIDLSQRQIELGQKVIKALEFQNLTMEVADLAEYEGPTGGFDYIAVHGVYSWIPQEKRDALLRQIKRMLAPQGVAYVSYNVFPGWYLRAPVREMMLYHVRGLSTPEERVAQARAFVEFASKAYDGLENAWAKLVMDEAELLRNNPDYYIFHEHLEEHNKGLYFHEFIEHAQTAGLQYLGEAGLHYGAETLKPEIRRGLEQSSSNLVELEQYVDFIKGRAFRRTLLVHDAIQLERAAPLSLLTDLHLTAQAKPVNKNPDVEGPTKEKFRNDDGVEIETSHPLAKAALLNLYYHWPASMTFPELVQRSIDRLGPQAPSLEEAKPLLAQGLIRLYLAGLLSVHTMSSPFARVLSERPKTSPLIGLQARSGARVINRRHREVMLSGLDRLILGMLDGTRGRDELLSEGTNRVLGGSLEMKRGEEKITDPSVIRQVLEQELDGCLQRLAASAVLVD